MDENYLEGLESIKGISENLSKQIADNLPKVMKKLKYEQ